MIQLPGVLAAAAELQDFYKQRGWKFCFIGGVAVQAWGNPRLTQDVDLTILTGFGEEWTPAPAPRPGLYGLGAGSACREMTFSSFTRNSGLPGFSVV